MNDEDVAESLLKWDNHSVFNSPITKSNSPTTYLGGGNDDDIVAYINSPISDILSPIVVTLEVEKNKKQHMK